jgi:hypothetical protein
MPIRTINSPLTTYAKEAAVIGRLLAGYGELEYRLVECGTHVLGSMELAFDTLFCIRGEMNRLKIANSLLRIRFRNSNLLSEYDEYLKGMDHCRMIRNQYAHCHYATGPRQLCIFSMEEAVKRVGFHTVSTLYKINLGTLKRQESYFLYVEQGLRYLVYKYCLNSNIKVEPWQITRKPRKPKKPPINSGYLDKNSPTIYI